MARCTVSLLIRFQGRRADYRLTECVQRAEPRPGEELSEGVLLAVVMDPAGREHKLQLA